MSEEEKKAIEILKSYENKLVYEISEKDKEVVTVVLKLIEKQQKELNNLKEIEQSHKEENGKLRVELEQEKEKNKELEHEILKRQWVKVDENGNIEPVFYISKDKIKEKIEEYEKMIEGTFKDNTWYGQNRRDNCYEIIRNLKELLEEK